jgi:hypothetical protein
MSDKPKGRVWGLVVAIVVELILCLVVLAPTAVLYRKFFTPGALGQIAAVFGVAALLVATATWLVLDISFIRRRAPARRWLYLAILIGLALGEYGALGAAVMVDAQHKAVARAARASAEQDANLKVALEESVTAAVTLASPQGGGVKLVTHAAGEAGVLARAAKALLLDVMKIRNRRDDRIETLQPLPYSLDPRSMAVDPGLKKTLAGLEQSRAVVDDAGRAIAAQVRAFRAQIAALDVDGAAKRSALAWIDAALPDPDQDTTYKLKMIGELIAEVRDLQHPRGKWQITGTQFEFGDPRDLAVARAHARKLDQLRRRMMNGG